MNSQIMDIYVAILKNRGEVIGIEKHKNSYLITISVPSPLHQMGYYNARDIVERVLEPK